MKKIMRENGLFVLGGPETQLHDILWAVHDGKTVVEARGRKISGSCRLWWEVRGRSEEHTSELQSPTLISYAVFCLKRGGGKFRGVASYGGRSGAERCAFLSYTCKALALTEPERGVGL